VKLSWLCRKTSSSLIESRVSSLHLSESQIVCSLACNCSTKRSCCRCLCLGCDQAILKKAGKASALGSFEENDPNAAGEEEDEEQDAEEDSASRSTTVVDKLTDLLGKTGLTSK